MAYKLRKRTGRGADAAPDHVAKWFAGEASEPWEALLPCYEAAVRSYWDRWRQQNATAKAPYAPWLDLGGATPRAEGGRTWATACPDWEARIREGRSLVPDLPLFEGEAERALRVFKRLRLPDVIGTPTMAEACGPWFFPIVAALFGSYDPVTNLRYIKEIFQLIPKGNSKSSNGGAVMLTALLVNRRPEGEFVFIAPTIEIASIAFRQAKNTIRLDPVLADLFQVQEHIRKITHKKVGSALQVKAADTEVITGSKAVGTMIDETHVFAKKPRALEVFVELRGALTKRPDGFLFQTTTQSKEAPAGTFAAELEMARKVRDGRANMPLLPVLYELPEALSENGGWKDRKVWPLVNPNLGRSTNEQFLADEIERAELEGPAKLALIASQHFNVQIGVALSFNNWPGAEHWSDPRNVDRTLSLEELLRRSDCVTFGIDGGGLADLLGVGAVGREASGRWLHWGHAFAHRSVLDRYKAIAQHLRDFESDGDLTIVDRVGDDVVMVADLAEQIRDSGLFPQTGAIGVDPAGIGAVLDELGRRGFDASEEAKFIQGISQGWKLQTAIKTTERKVAGAQLVHAGTRLMAWCVGNARVEPRGNAIMVTKQASGFAKIDPLMALFDAAALMAMNPPAGRSVFDILDEDDGTDSPELPELPEEDSDADRAILADPRHRLWQRARERFERRFDGSDEW